MIIGFRHETWVHDGTFSVTVQVEIIDEDGNRVAINQYSDEQLVEGTGLQDWEGGMSFQASWEPGTYTAEVVIRDDVTEEVSDTGTTTFEITELEDKLEITREERYTEEFSSGRRPERLRFDARLRGGLGSIP